MASTSLTGITFKVIDLPNDAPELDMHQRCVNIDACIRKLMNYLIDKYDLVRSTNRLCHS